MVDVNNRSFDEVFFQHRILCKSAFPFVMGRSKSLWSNSLCQFNRSRNKNILGREFKSRRIGKYIVDEPKAFGLVFFQDESKQSIVISNKVMAVVQHHCLITSVAGIDYRFAVNSDHVNGSFREVGI